MDQIKEALTSLEESVLHLESAIQISKKNQTIANNQVAELKRALKTTYERLDEAIASYRQENV